MNDITSITTDLVVMDAQTPKAANVLSVQLGALEYAKDFGVDINFFIDENFTFQNESFKSYLIQRLAEHHVNVTQVIDTLENFFLKFGFTVGQPEEVTRGYIR